MKSSSANPKPKSESDLFKIFFAALIRVHLNLPHVGDNFVAISLSGLELAKIDDDSNRIRY